MDLPSIVAELARGLLAADALRPVAMSHRGTRAYQPGIGPHLENAAVPMGRGAYSHSRATYLGDVMTFDMEAKPESRVVARTTRGIWYDHTPAARSASARLAGQ
jgi:hypothetical protein